MRNKLKACSKFLLKNGVTEEKIREFRFEKESRRINLLHKCITRFVLNSSEFSVLPKAFNSLVHYVSLRKKMKRAAGLVLYRLRQPNLLKAFRMWIEASRSYTEQLSSYTRDDLLKRSIVHIKPKAFKIII